MRIPPFLPLTLGVLVAVPVLPALAQPAGPGDQEPNPTIEQMAQQRLERLRQEIGITPAQQEAWDRFARVSMQNAAQMDQMFRQRAEQIPRMNAEQNLRSFAELQMRQAREFQRVVPAFDQLYASLSPQQRQRADRAFREMADWHSGRERVQG